MSFISEIEPTFHLYSIFNVEQYKNTCIGFSIEFRHAFMNYGSICEMKINISDLPSTCNYFASLQLVIPVLNELNFLCIVSFFSCSEELEQQ